MTQQPAPPDRPDDSDGPESTRSERHSPPETADPYDLGGALYDAIGLVARRLRHSRAPGELSLPERSALSRLAGAGPASAAELARAEQVTAQAMGTVVNGLETRGFVERRPDPHDGRRIIVSLTEAGEGVLRRKREARGRQLATVLTERFTPAELQTLAAAAPLLERLGENL
ncbi:MarR family winged helix-turn-helix transcriptional regulator [Streptomyces sennicomposti]|uniref:MarR family winged helix-turn-helix transcriptional regulator n=1 Tax=Streptomyces sennicomposti TaxID=2873384 RepID=UPI0027E13211|nr:MarR family transcriptional regulator [Streptomyces sennicomposti]